MTKLLDLDSILPPKKSIKFGGQEDHLFRAGTGAAGGNRL